jgi:hypothetical protein
MKSLRGTSLVILALAVTSCDVESDGEVEPELTTTELALTATFEPTGDAEVRSDTSTPLGTDTYLSAYLPGSGGVEARSYLSFDTSAIPNGSTITSATLRLYVTNGTDNGPTVRRANAGFVESTVTWADQPGYGTTVYGNLGAATTAGVWYEIPLGPGLVGDDVVHMVLIGESNDSIRGSSREVSNPPQLVVAYSESTTFYPSADAEVRSDTATPLGGDTYLSSYLPNAGVEARSYLTFDTSAIPNGSTITSATLRVYATNGTDDGPTVRRANAGFVESSVTWADQPGYGSTIYGNLGTATATGVWYEIPLSAGLVGDGLVHLALIGESSDSVRVNSREASNPPELVVTHEMPSSVCGNGVCEAGETWYGCNTDCPGTCEGCLWSADYDVSDPCTQWSACQRQTPSRITGATSPVREGSHSGRFEVQYGDVVNGGARAEVVHCLPGACGGEIAGTERWYGWSTYWPTSFNSQPTWQVFTQWHHLGNSGSPPISFYTNGSTMYLSTTDSAGGEAHTIHWTAPLVTGQWRSFIFGVRFANDGTGWVELWLDGVQVLPRTSTRTMRDDGNILKQGLYRKDTIDFTQVIHHDNMRKGSTRSQVD